MTSKTLTCASKYVQKKKKLKYVLKKIKICFKIQKFDFKKLKTLRDNVFWIIIEQFIIMRTQCLTKMKFVFILTEKKNLD